MIPESPRRMRKDDGSVVEVPLALKPLRIWSGWTPSARWRVAAPRGGAAKSRDAAPSGGWTPDPWWRLRAALLRRLEAVAKWIVLRGAHPDTIADLKTETGRGYRDTARGPVPEGEPDPPPMTLGHGCPGPGLPVVAPDGSEAAGTGTLSSGIVEACVVGEGAVAADLIGRLVTRGARVHATAATADDHAALLARGAVPVRFDELPALAPRFDLLVSTSQSAFVDVRIVARLSEQAAIVDLAPAPGSVDFETAKRLGRDVRWLRPGPGHACCTDAAWCVIADIVEATARDGGRS